MCFGIELSAQARHKGAQGGKSPKTAPVLIVRLSQSSCNLYRFEVVNRYDRHQQHRALDSASVHARLSANANLRHHGSVVLLWVYGVWLAVVVEEHLNTAGVCASLVRFADLLAQTRRANPCGIHP